MVKSINELYRRWSEGTATAADVVKVGGDALLTFFQTTYDLRQNDDLPERLPPANPQPNLAACSSAPTWGEAVAQPGVSEHVRVVGPETDWRCARGHEALSHLLRCSDKTMFETLQEFDNFSPNQPTPQYVRGCVRQVLSGSTRTADRLAAAQLWESDMCPGCQQTKETACHMFRCQQWNPEGDVGRSIQSRSPDARMETPAFQCLSVFVEPDWVQHTHKWLLQVATPRNNARWQELPKSLYTDGSTLNSQFPDATLAGAGYHATFEQAPARTYGCIVPGLQQGSDRAEVYALKQAVAKLLEVATSLRASGEVTLKCDCQWVVKRFQKLHLSQGEVRHDEAHYDLWEKIHPMLHKLDQLSVSVCAAWIPSHTTEKDVRMGVVQEGDRLCNDLADKAAKRAVQRAVQQVGGQHFVKNLQNDIQACVVQQLHNMLVVNKGWEAVKGKVPDEGDDDNQDEGCRASDDPAPVVSQPASSSVSLVDQASGINLDQFVPQDEHVKQCRKEVPYYAWKDLPGLQVHKRGITPLSRAAAGYSWHLPQTTLDSLHNYFHHLEWTSQGKVSMFELFCDFYAFSGGVELLHPKSGRTSALQTCADFTSAFASAVRLLPRQYKPQIAAVPATQALVSHLTAFNLPKQAVGFNQRPKLRQPSRVHAMLAWLRMQSEAFTSWKWKVPIHILTD